ncbi:MAG: hypothetical protein DRI39_04325 [Chloroflexi bacterium]|nr:MAG: hypothetical protein DRI39_04325 [Chloroflexota bacterium]RLC95989.1 MAG: hypothetical protein DRI40_04390 [Chloroflexota bacterium]
MGMTVYNEDGTVASVFTGIERKGERLILRQLALGTMPMDVIVTPEEALKSVKLGLNWGVISFVLGFPYFWLKHRRQKERMYAAAEAPTEEGGGQG